jgi:HK97 gp10 family phage protein
MSSVKVTINGDPIKGNTAGTIKSIITVATYVVNNAKALAPVDLGRLRNSIMYKLFDGSAHLFNNEDGGADYGEPAEEREKISLNPENETTAYAGTNAEYAVYQEFGTKFMAPQPYMRPAGLLARGVPADVVKREMNNEMAKALKAGKKRKTFNV